MSVVDRAPAGRVLVPLAVLVLFVATWKAATVLLSIPAFVLPPPEAVLARLAGDPVLYAENAGATLAKVLGGGGVGIVGGFVLALGMGTVPLLRRTIYPYVVVARTLPKIAIAPLLLLYIGVGFDTAVVFVASVAFFPMVVSTSAGFERTPERQRDLLRSVDAGPIRTTFAVELPYALPDIFAGVKQSVTLSVVGAIVAEWVVATSGLGYLVLIAAETVQPSVMLASLSILTAMGLCLYGAVVAVQRRVDWIPDASTR